jgi:alpha-mannosidase
MDAIRFPHSTFYWEGIDGSSVLAHFPPADTYNAAGSAEELMKCAENHQSKMYRYTVYTNINAHAR